MAKGGVDAKEQNEVLCGDKITGIGYKVVPRLRESRHLAPSGHMGACSRNLGPTF